MNGDYKGNPIVLIKSSGKQLVTNEVPGQILDGNTMVPISVLRQLGASVTWDPNTYSVDVKIPTSDNSQNVDFFQVIKGFNETAKQYNASNIQLVYNNIGTYISADLNINGTSQDTTNIMLTSSFVAKSPAIQIFIHVYKNNVYLGVYDIRKTDVEKFINNSLPTEDFIKSWIWTSNTSTPQPISTNTSTTTTTTTTTTTNTPTTNQAKVKGPLTLYSSDGKKYLGILTADKYGLDSVFNEYGTYGSKYGLNSIWNEYGDYGSKYSLKSAFNDYTTTPPIILDGDGNICGYLTTNTTIKGGISPVGLYSFLKNEGY
ncbi:stalk domain-containing protein [Paenibacillus sp. Soil750]|uniref:stalk domain-containing protein n=1 Tax=Paenibacillus sp. Soil750 TaxID=1736398 RepID=UPI0006FDD071|nr:hypothetical protein [Paenibacillus sp. Soil750]KRE70840.1 hypothetical protein ASL11_11135 [Paenibacillus sp. Soil750]